MSENLTLVSNIVRKCRESRTSTTVQDAFVEFSKIAEKHSLSYTDLAVIAGSMLLTATMGAIKQDNGGVADATATAFQVVSDLTSNPEAMVKLWGIS